MCEMPRITFLFKRHCLQCKIVELWINFFNWNHNLSAVRANNEIKINIFETTSVITKNYNRPLD